MKKSSCWQRPRVCCVRSGIRACVVVVGGGSGRAVATGLGVVGGAILGNNLQGPGGIQCQTVQNVYENHTVDDHVVYEYAGKQYAVQLPQDPGQTIPLQVSPAVQSMPVNQAVIQINGVYAPPVIAPAPVRWYQATPYAAPYVSPQALIKDAGTKVFLILDHLRVPHRKLVKAWVAEHKDELELLHADLKQMGKRLPAREPRPSCARLLRSTWRCWGKTLRA